MHRGLATEKIKNEEHDGLQIKILPIVKVKFHLELRMDRIKASERRREGQK